jgi:ankyrin repeat protein
VKYNTHNRNSEFSSQLFDAIYDNNFELAKNLIDGGQVDVNIKNDYGDTPLIAVCQQTTFLLFMAEQSIEYNVDVVRSLSGHYSPHSSLLSYLIYLMSGTLNCSAINN